MEQTATKKELKAAKKGLTGKDLITVGIYTAIYIASIFLVGMFNAIPIFYPIFMFVGPVLIGIPMMLYYIKIEKFGMLTITGIICAVFFYISGYTWICVAIIVPASLIADIALKIGVHSDGDQLFDPFSGSYGRSGKSLVRRRELLGEHQKFDGRPVR